MKSFRPGTTPTPITESLARAAWRTSSRSQMSNCVEVAPLAGDRGPVALRDSKDRTGPVLLFSRRQWSDFITGTQFGAFD